MTTASKRTSKNLRDILLDEIEHLRGESGNPARAQAVANLAKQIISTVKVEMDYHREAARMQERGNPITLGSVNLGSSAVFAVSSATEPSSAPTSPNAVYPS